MSELALILRRDAPRIPVLFDVEDLGWVMDLPTLRLQQSGKKMYAVCAIRHAGRTRKHLVSRLIAGLLPGDDREADHIDGNTLDNRRANLRIVTRSFQQTTLRPIDSDRAMGVAWNRKRQRWIVTVQVCGRRLYGGSFIQHTDAVVAAGELRSSMIDDALAAGRLDPPEQVPSLEENVALLDFLDTIPRGHWAARRTHCKNGHPFDGTNSYVRGGARICRACARDRDIRARALKYVVNGGTDG